MALKTNFSFEVRYPAESARSQAEQAEVMDALEGSLRGLLAVQDPQVGVMVSDSQGSGTMKRIELTTLLGDEQLADVLKAFAERHGVSFSVLE